MEAYSIVKEEDQFESARAHFEDLVWKLRSASALKTDHATLEQQLQVDGCELLRQLFQSHLDLRELSEPSISVIGSDDVERRCLRASQRSLMTVFGPVVIGRLQASAKGYASLHPLDSELNLPHQRQSFGVQKRVAEDAAQRSFDEVVSRLAKETGATVSKRQTELLVMAAAQDFEAFYASQCPAESTAEQSELLVMSCDGKGIVVRLEDLREATRKAAESQKHKLNKRLSRGEKRNRKRMVEVAAVYSVAPNQRTVEEVLGELQSRRVRRAAPRATKKRVWASVRAGLKEVIAEMFEEAQRRDPEQRQRWVVLVDGNKDQIKQILKQAKERKVKITLLLDFIHVAEYLWKAAYSFNAEASQEAEAWVRERLAETLRGRSSEVAAGITRSATLRKLCKAKRQAADKCAAYLVANRALLRYDEALTAGFPIATGIIEGACRHLVKDRMDITGARWSLDGAEAVLRLRALRSSGDFDEYWRFHLACEHERNHLSQYAGANPRNGIPQIRRAKSSCLHVVAE
ncbi:MAG: ISKra4 family transposase [Myxococcota bacterium]|jgi:hypothetical protein|nr:ISKra4 family transposase [Myxococcota bacterium]